MDVLKKVQLPNIVVSSEDKIATKRLKIISNTIGFIPYSQRLTGKKETLKRYYQLLFQKYIEKDIPRFSCTTSLQYSVMETLAKINLYYRLSFLLILLLNIQIMIILINTCHKTVKTVFSAEIQLSGTNQRT